MTLIKSRNVSYSYFDKSCKGTKIHSLTGLCANNESALFYRDSLKLSSRVCIFSHLSQILNIDPFNFF